MVFMRLRMRQSPRGDLWTKRQGYQRGASFGRRRGRNLNRASGPACKQGSWPAFDRQLPGGFHDLAFMCRTCSEQVAQQAMGVRESVLPVEIDRASAAQWTERPVRKAAKIVHVPGGPRPRVFQDLVGYAGRPVAPSAVGLLRGAVEKKRLQL